MKIKLYYNDYPGQRINDKKITDNTNKIYLLDRTWERGSFTSFHHVLNTLGIEYEWSNIKEESVTILDIGSLAIESNLEVIENTLQKYLQEFKKVILFTSQEPVLIKDINYLLDKYDNLFIMDVRYSENSFHERYIPFPFLITRLMNNFLDVTELTPNIQLTNYDEKIHDFNNLKYRWTPDKFATQFYINEYNFDNNIVTYQRPTHLTLDGSYAEKLELKTQVYDFFDYNDTPIKKRSLNFIYDFLDRHPTVGLTPDKPFNIRYRYHPTYVYDECYYSLITENLNFEINDNTVSVEDVEQNFYISEKTLYPIMQGHPFKVLGNPGMNYMLEHLGFRLYDEILDYDYDFVFYPVERLKQGVKSCESFDRGLYQTHIKDIINKVLHNQKLIMNVNSPLWEKLRQTMLRNIQKYYEL